MALRHRPGAGGRRSHNYFPEERQHWIDEIIEVEQEDGSIRAPKYKIAELEKMRANTATRALM